MSSMHCCFILVAFNDHSLSFYSVKFIYYLYISDHRVRTTLGNIDSTVAILAQGNHRFETSAQPLFFFYGSNPVMISFLSSVANASRRGEMLPKFGFSAGAAIFCEDFFNGTTEKIIENNGFCYSYTYSMICV